MKVAADRGNRLHAPENTALAFVSAYTLGADVLRLEVRLTGDDRVVVAADDDVSRLTRDAGLISKTTLHDLRGLDFSATYRPRGSTTFSYRPPGRSPVQIESFPALLDLLPPDVELLVELRDESGRMNSLAKQVVAAVVNRGMLSRVVLFSSDPSAVQAVRSRAHDAAVAVSGAGLAPQDQLRLVTETSAGGLVTELAAVLHPGGTPTELGAALADLATRGLLPLGVAASPAGPAFSAQEHAAAAAQPFVSSLSTGSMFDVAAIVRPGWSWVEESLDGTEVNTRLFAFGYAKANRYCHVFQDDGVHVKIAPYDGPPDVPLGDPLQERLRDLQEQLWYSAKTWPFYSGGGFGLVPGIAGNFAAEVDLRQDLASQATMCEMAVVNADPGAHHPPSNPDGSPRLPATMRDKDIFFDPHGAPPFVGSEHDEDDGFRINWNLGTDYDNNQYGKPVGNGKALTSRLRLERRGPFFSTYYRDGTDATEWVCTGVTRNDSLNPVVYLRCAGKRWRQETDQDPSKFFPIVANEIVFRNLLLTRFLGEGSPDAG